MNVLTSATSVDVAGASEWLQAALRAARTARVPYVGMATLVPDGPPYVLELVLVDAPVSKDALWDEGRAWRYPTVYRPRSLKKLVDVAAAGSPQREAADYIVPLAYAALVLRDVLRKLTPAERGPLTTAVVMYHGGDGLDVPVERT